MPELMLDDPERMFDQGAGRGLGAIAGALRIRQRSPDHAALMRAVARRRRMRGQHRALPEVGGIAVHRRLLARQQAAQFLAVVHIGGRHRRMMNATARRTHPNVQFVPEVSVALFPRLAGFRVGVSRGVLRRLRGFHHGRIHHGAAADRHARRVQRGIHNLHQFRGEVGLAESRPKFDQRGPIRHLLEMRVETAEGRHAPRVKQQFDCLLVGQPIPLLNQVDAQHAFVADRLVRTPAGRRFRRDGPQRVRPRHDVFHPIQELLLAGFAAVHAGLLRGGENGTLCGFRHGDQ